MQRYPNSVTTRNRHLLRHTVEVAVLLADLNEVVIVLRERLAHRFEERLRHVRRRVVRRAFELLADGHANALVRDDLVVAFRVAGRALRLEAGLVVIRTLVHQRLDGEHHRGERLRRRPLGPGPRAQDAETHLPVRVQVRIEADGSYKQHLTSRYEC